MTGEEAVAYIWSHGWEAHAPGLDRIRELLRRLGDPQKELKFIHAAGTNGKGSVCACLASVLEAAGYRVGLNTSPHLERFHERIRVNGQEISDGALGAVMERVRSAAGAMRVHPTEFELITAAAFLYFLEQRCDIVVLETGLGGELDASNVIETPELAILTAMGMDHAAILGPTLRDVAAAKAGIIKAGGTVVSRGGCPEADEVFRRTCRERGAFLTETDLSRLRVRRLDLEGAVFDFAPWENLTIPLVGAYQAENAALALTALEVLREKGWSIPEEALRRGLAAVRWPGRFEILGRAPAVLLDGAHNAHGMRAAVESLRTLFPGKQLTFLLGILADKDAGEMLDLLAPLAERAFVLRPDSPRAMDPAALCALLAARGVEALPCTSAAAGLEAALAAAGRDGAVCALGSLYLCGEVRSAWFKRR
ncbi:MAG: bifunctional folylpolyglutamate synthase/dihydrofolate synthase [Oscillibacter sp.]|jgi:dihydrofolate synthase/folylpolyglutamate synthase|nr:bifunctional folylpolyglutamate synthase/dihydrofolate synthase [Oscillibacter sp.]